ncbi:MAG: GNAT family N-acetyltransferase [Armatimonadota bacterium]|jgi:predicted N-acetyltransferase YhbS
MPTTVRALHESEFDEHAELVYVSYTHGREVPAGSMLTHRDWWLRGIERDPYYVPEQTRVMEVDGALVASVTCYHRPSYVMGREVRAACIGSVCTHPDHRRRGYVREVLAEAVEWMTAEGCEWSFLYGLSEVYGGSGWLNLATWDCTTELRLRDDLGGELTDRAAEPDADAALLADLHARFNRGLTGPTVRSERYWRSRMLGAKVTGEPPAFRIVESDRGPVGYYHLEGEAVREIAWADRAEQVLAHVMRRAGGERVSFDFCTMELLALLRDISAIPEQKQCREGEPGGVTLTEAYRGLWRLHGGAFCEEHGIEDTQGLLQLLREHDYVMWPGDRA